MSRLTLVAAAALLACGPVTAFAQSAPAPDKPAAVRLLSAIQAADAGGGVVPRLSDPASAPIIRAAFDRSVLAGPLEFDEYQRVCAPAAAAQMGYALYDLDREGIVDKSTAQGAATVNRVMARNGARYQDEVALGLAFQLRCSVAVAPAMGRLIDGLPPGERDLTRRQGMAQFRHGLSQIYQGAVIMVVESGTSPANRILIIEEAVLQADGAAALLSIADRRQVITMIDRAAPYAAGPVTREGFARIRASMSRTDCGTLCAF